MGEKLVVCDVVWFGGEPVPPEQRRDNVIVRHVAYEAVEARREGERPNMSIESRLGRIERALGMDVNEDKPFVLEVASGERFVTTPRQLREIIQDIQRSNRRLLPGAHHGAVYRNALTGSRSSWSQTPGPSCAGPIPTAPSSRCAAVEA